MKMIQAALTIFCMALISTPMCAGIEDEIFGDLTFLKLSKEDVQSSAILDSLIPYQSALNECTAIQAKSALMKAEQFLTHNPDCHFKNDIRYFMAIVRRNVNRVVNNS